MQEYFETLGDVGDSIEDLISELETIE